MPLARRSFPGDSDSIRKGLDRSPDTMSPRRARDRRSRHPQLRSPPRRADRAGGVRLTPPARATTGRDEFIPLVRTRCRGRAAIEALRAPHTAPRHALRSSGFTHSIGASVTLGPHCLAYTDASAIAAPVRLPTRLNECLGSGRARRHLLPIVAGVALALFRRRPPFARRRIRRDFSLDYDAAILAPHLSRRPIDDPLGEPALRLRRLSRFSTARRQPQNRIPTLPSCPRPFRPLAGALTDLVW